MSYHPFEQTIEERTAAIMNRALSTVVDKWRHTTTPIWRAEHRGFEATARHVTFIFRTALERQQAGARGCLNAMREDLADALSQQSTHSLRVDVYSITFTDLDEDSTFLFP